MTAAALRRSLAAAVAGVGAGLLLGSDCGIPVACSAESPIESVAGAFVFSRANALGCSASLPHAACYLFASIFFLLELCEPLKL